MKQKISEIIGIINSFVQSDLFLALEALLILIGWSFDIWAIMLPILCALNTLPLFIGRSTKHMLGLLMMLTLIISANRHGLNSFASILTVLPVMLTGVLFNLIYFKRSFSPLDPKNIKGFHCSLIALIIPAAFAGVTLPATNAVARVTALALFIVIAFVYTLFVVTNRDKEERSKLMELVLKSLLLMGIVVSCQMLIYFVRSSANADIIELIKAKKIDLGWGGPNNVAPVLSMCIPATLYFCIKRNKLTPVYVALAALEYALIFTTGCRGAILFTTLAMPALLFYTVIKSQNKMSFSVTICVCFAVAVVLIACFGKQSAAILSAILNKELNSAGRTEWLYPEAIELFKRAPIFGGGWDYRLGELAGDSYSPYWFHSTALQVLGMMGIVGVIAYACFYFFRYRTFLVMHNNPAALALMAGTALFDAYGMVDTNFFGPTFFVMLLCMTFAVEMNLPDDKCRAFAGINPFQAAYRQAKHLIAAIKLRAQAKKRGSVGYYQKSVDEEEVTDSDIRAHRATKGCERVCEPPVIADKAQNEFERADCIKDDAPEAVDEAQESDETHKEDTAELADDGSVKEDTEQGDPEGRIS